MYVESFRFVGGAAGLAAAPSHELGCIATRSGIHSRPLHREKERSVRRAVEKHVLQLVPVGVHNENLSSGPPSVVAGECHYSRGIL